MSGKNQDVPFAIGAHNGVIRNTEELKNKYKSFKGGTFTTDSMLLLNILVESKRNPELIKVLNDYEGFAALLWYYPGSDVLYAFRGKSDSGEDSTGERPLYYWKVKGTKEVYISSIEEALKAICTDDHENIQQFEPNIIYAIDQGVITKLKTKITREKKNTTPVYNTTAKKEKPADVFVGFPAKALKKANKIKEFDSTHYWLESEPYFNEFHNGKVVYYGGKYTFAAKTLGENLNTGESIVLDNNGIKEGYKQYNGVGQEYHFWNGWLCKDSKSMNECIDAYKDKASKLHNKFQHSKKDWDLDFFSDKIIGIVFNKRDTGGWYRKADIKTGPAKWSPEFNQGKVYEFSNGWFVRVTYTKPTNEQEPIPLPAGSSVSGDKLMNNYDAEAINTLGELKEQIQSAIADAGVVLDKTNLNGNSVPGKSKKLLEKMLEFLTPNLENLEGKALSEEKVEELV